MNSSDSHLDESRRHFLWEGPLGVMVLIEEFPARSSHGHGPHDGSEAASLLHGVFFHDQRHLPPESDWGPEAPDSPLLLEAASQLEEYFAGDRDAFALPLSARGTDFQRRIWAELQKIPEGETRTYGEIAKAAGSPRASQAAGQAVGRNPWAIIVPCHRILGARGAVTGYAGGVHRKLSLLAKEGVHPGLVALKSASAPASGDAGALG